MTTLSPGAPPPEQPAGQPVGAVVPVGEGQVRPVGQIAPGHRSGCPTAMAATSSDATPRPAIGVPLLVDRS